jgi:ubiquinone biosynthesis accessory factor UbiK
MNNYSPKKLIDDFVQQFSGSTEKTDHNQIRALLESLLRKLNLVTREEFDAQAAVLARTRKRLQDLEVQVANLETKIKDIE